MALLLHNCIMHTVGSLYDAVQQLAVSLCIPPPRVVQRCLVCVRHDCGGIQVIGRGGRSGFDQCSIYASKAVTLSQQKGIDDVGHGSRK